MKPLPRPQYFAPSKRRPDIFHVAAEAGEIGAEHEALARAGAEAAVEAVVDQRETDRRGRAIADRVAQIAARPQRIADVGDRIVISRLVQADFVIGQAIAARQRPIFGQWQTGADLEAGRHLSIGCLALVVNGRS